MIYALWITMKLSEIAEQIVELLYLDDSEYDDVFAWLKKNDDGQEVEELAEMYAEYMGD